MKECSHCGVLKPIQEFMRVHGTRKGLFTNCNRCSEQKKQNSTSKSSINKDIMQEDNSSYLQPESNLDSGLLTTIKDDNEDLIYELEDLEELVSTHFSNNEHVEFSAIIELSNKFIEETLSNETGPNDDSSQGDGGQ
ncbi:25532_t:CDS:1, partial [Dentiscutata erythropus]